MELPIDSFTSFVQPIESSRKKKRLLGYENFLIRAAVEPKSCLWQVNYKKYLKMMKIAVSFGLERVDLINDLTNDMH